MSFILSRRHPGILFDNPPPPLPHSSVTYPPPPISSDPSPGDQAQAEFGKPLPLGSRRRGILEVTAGDFGWLPADIAGLRLQPPGDFQTASSVTEATHWAFSHSVQFGVGSLWNVCIFALLCLHCDFSISLRYFLRAPDAERGMETFTRARCRANGAKNQT